MAELLYGPDGPAEHDLKLIGDVAGKRALLLGCGDATIPVTFAETGAVVIAVDSSASRLAQARRLAEEHEVRLEFRPGDLADLAFMRADSVDIVFSAYSVDTVADSARLFRQVQRVLKPNTPFVFSYAHPLGLLAGGGPRSAYFDAAPVTVSRFGEEVTVYPKALSETFTDLVRAGFRIDAFVEPRSAGEPIPATAVWRARKEGS